MALFASSLRKFDMYCAPVRLLKVKVCPSMLISSKKLKIFEWSSFQKVSIFNHRWRFSASSIQKFDINSIPIRLLKAPVQPCTFISSKRLKKWAFFEWSSHQKFSKVIIDGVFPHFPSNLRLLPLGGEDFSPLQIQNSKW